MARWLLPLLLILLTFPLLHGGGTGKAPIPGKAAQDKALQLVLEVFQDDLTAAKEAAAKVKLSSELLQQGRDTKDDQALRYVLLLDGTPRVCERPAIAPLPGALAAIELLRGTWGASVDFEGGLRWISQLIDGVPCGRLQAGPLDATVECVVSWLEARRG